MATLLCYQLSNTYWALTPMSEAASINGHSGEILKILPIKFALLSLTALKVAFSQKGLMRSLFFQTDKPNYFPELEF